MKTGGGSIKALRFLRLLFTLFAILVQFLHTNFLHSSMQAMKRVDGTIQKGHHSSYMISAGDEKVMNDWIEAIKQNSFTNPYMQLIMKKKMQKVCVLFVLWF